MARIRLKSPDEIEQMAVAGAIVAAVLDRLGEACVPGVSTAELDRIAADECRRLGGEPAFLGLYGFPASLCVAVNDQVLHGIPSPRTILRDGDVVGCDFGARARGWYGDAARTFPVGTVSQEAARLLRVTREALELALGQCHPGRTLGDIGHAIERHATLHGFSVVRRFVGHGIGLEPHEEPKVKNYGLPGRGTRLEPGLVIAVEPMVNAGRGDVEELADGWTIVTSDGRLSAHFEHTVAITDGGPRVLTAGRGGPQVGPTAPSQGG